MAVLILTAVMLVFVIVGVWHATSKIDQKCPQCGQAICGHKRGGTV